MGSTRPETPRCESNGDTLRGRSRTLGAGLNRYAPMVSRPLFVSASTALDEALEVASKNPGANFGILELRPIES
jgi:hypothetical protein